MERTPGSLLGNAVPRIEDRRFLVGASSYVDDLRIDGVRHLEFVRSAVAHGHSPHRHALHPGARVAGHRRGHRRHTPLPLA
jgi:CO/xanthine dehydrogenase Mo-binding subunit